MDCSFVRRPCHQFTFSNENITGVSLPFAIKFRVKRNQVVGKAT